MLALIPDPERPGRVRPARVTEPEPRDDEAVVQVAAFSPNRGETFLLEHPRPGWRPGKDVAGTVVQPAADGTGPGVGARVVGHPERGGWAERVSVASSRLAVLPDEVPFATAAALPLAGLTALRLTRVSAPMASRSVLLTGASGGVGHYFVELAAAQGALISVVSSTPERGRRLRELGAVAVVTDVEDAVGPFEIVLDSVGGEVTRTAWHKLERHGLLVWFGQASRVAPALDFFDWDGAQSVTIRKFNYMESTHSEASDLDTLVRLVAAGRLHPEIGLLDDWDRAGEAIEELIARRVRGNAVLTIGEVQDTKPLIADGDRVALEWTSHARTVTGEAYDNRCAGIFTIRHGKIQAVNEYMDTHRAHHAVTAARS
jgi:NADPH2:quinone reductase